MHYCFLTWVHSIWTKMDLWEDQEYCFLRNEGMDCGKSEARNLLWKRELWNGFPSYFYNCMLKCGGLDFYSNLIILFENIVDVIILFCFPDFNVMKPQSVLWLPLTVSEMLQWKSAVWVFDDKSNMGNHATIQASIKKKPKTTTWNF